MAIFDFGKRQRLHTQLVGHTSGRELFKVDEYNKRKKITIGIIAYNLFIGTMLYFSAGQYISTKMLVFLIISMVGTLIWGWFNYKQQKRLREGLY